MYTPYDGAAGMIDGNREFYMVKKKKSLLSQYDYCSNLCTFFLQKMKEVLIQIREMKLQTISTDNQ